MRNFIVLAILALVIQCIYCSQATSLGSSIALLSSENVLQLEKYLKSLLGQDILDELNEHRNAVLDKLEVTHYTTINKVDELMIQAAISLESIIIKKDNGSLDLRHLVISIIEMTIYYLLPVKPDYVEGRWMDNFVWNRIMGHLTSRKNRLMVRFILDLGFRFDSTPSFAFTACENIHRLIMPEVRKSSKLKLHNFLESKGCSFKLVSFYHWYKTHFHREDDYILPKNTSFKPMIQKFVPILLQSDLLLAEKYKILASVITNNDFYLFEPINFATISLALQPFRPDVTDWQEAIICTVTLGMGCDLDLKKMKNICSVIKDGQSKPSLWIVMGDLIDRNCIQDMIKILSLYNSESIRTVWVVSCNFSENLPVYQLLSYKLKSASGAELHQLVVQMKRLNLLDESFNECIVTLFW